MDRTQQTIEAKRLFALADVIGDRHLIHLAAGPLLDPIVLSLEQPPDYRAERPGGASFARKWARRPNRFRIHHRAGKEWQSIDLDKTTEKYHFAQSLANGEWLLVRGRAQGDGDENAHVCDSSGRHVRSFHAGDGIQDVQTTPGGRIWVSFFDEGVFGDTRLGQAGLVCLDRQGRCLFDFAQVARGEVPLIADCYALNVVSDDLVWLDYYMDFPLVKLLHLSVQGLWRDLPVKGSPAFAIAGDRAVFAGGYSGRDGLVLVRLGDRRAQKRVAIDENGRPLTRFSAFGRSNRLFLQTSEAVHVVEAVD